MTIEQLRYFTALAKNKNFTAAAEECFISQSSLSKQIKSLEKELGGVRLFDRNTKKLEITDAGREFFVFASRVLSEHGKLMRDMKKYTSGRMEQITVGSLPVMNHYGLTDVFYKFQDFYSHIKLILKEKQSIDLVEEFNRGKVDMAILWDNYLPERNYKSYPILSDELVLITNREHRLAQYDIIDLQEAENEKFLFIGSNTGMYNTCRQACLQAGFAPVEENLDVRSSTIKDFVANGQGVSLNMYHAVQYMRDPRIKIIRLKDPVTLNLLLILRGDNPTDAQKAFIEFVMDSYGQL